MGLVTICTLLWDANQESKDFSRCYDESWAQKLFNGFGRNLTLPHRFVLYTDRKRDLPANIEQVIEPTLGQNGYGDCIRPYEMNVPMILCGLDTVVTGNCDSLAEYCLTEKRFALPRDPYHPNIACNGVALVPAGHGMIAETHQGENDMVWVRSFPHNYIDSHRPGLVRSYKGYVERNGLGNARVVFFHGQRKPHQILHVEFVREHWR